MTASKKKAAGLASLKNLQPTSTEITPEKPIAKKIEPKKKTKPPSPTPVKSKANSSTSSPIPMKGFNLNLPLEAYEKLREIAFHEKNSMTSLVLEGIDLVLESRGLPALAKKKE